MVALSSAPPPPRAMAADVFEGRPQPFLLRFRLLAEVPAGASAAARRSRSVRRTWRPAAGLRLTLAIWFGACGAVHRMSCAALVALGVREVAPDVVAGLRAAGSEPNSKGQT